MSGYLTADHVGHWHALEAARAATARPEGGQAKAGNYPKGRLRFHGIPITLENPRGSIREGVGAGGRRWRARMAWDYGYVRLAAPGADGDHVDCFIGPALDSRLVFIVNQIDQRTGKFDEHKAMLGFDGLPEAVAGYLANYERGWKLGPVTTLTLGEFKDWLRDGDHTAALPEWWRPCLWCDPDYDPHHHELGKAERPGVILTNPDNHLGIDAIGRAHWMTDDRTPAGQLSLFGRDVPPSVQAKQKKQPKAPPAIRPSTREILPFHEYDNIIVSFSGGKDSIACVLSLLERGVPPERIELWHQHVDGEPGSPALFDWPVTAGYVEAFAKAFGLKLRHQWHEGGIYAEMMRKDAYTRPTSFQAADGTFISRGGTGGKILTREKYPMPGAIDVGRWCSAYAKIQVTEKALRNLPEFQSAKTLFVTGERRQEGGNRATYAESEPHGTDTAEKGGTRRIDWWRPVIDWPERDVWAIMQRHGVRPHPAYELGFSRLSCRTCVFGNNQQWATIRRDSPTTYAKHAHLEKLLGHTIQQKGKKEHAEPYPLDERTEGEAPYPPPESLGYPHGLAELAALAEGRDYDADLLIPADQWVTPPGAYKGEEGPT